MANDFKIRKGLIVLGSGSSTPTDIYGSQGELFSITDSLSGSLFSVNDISGIPVIEAFSNNWVNLGTFNNEGLKVRGNTIIATGSFSGSFSGSLVGSSSYALTASFALNAGSGTSSGTSYVITNRRTGSYTLTLSDAFKLIEMDSGSANLLTIPSSSTVNFLTGSTIDVVQYGAGQTQIASASTGVTLRSANNWTKINARYGAVTLVKIATDEWYLFGNLNA